MSATVPLVALVALVGGLVHEDRANLAAILGLKSNSTTEEICETVRRLYQSRVRSKIREGAGSTARWVKSYVTDASVDDSKAAFRNNVYPVPTWDDLV